VSPKRGPLARLGTRQGDWRRALVLSEILGPCLARRALDAGAARPAHIHGVRDDQGPSTELGTETPPT
jgi:hypothetical protein